MVDRELASPHAQREFAVPKKPDTFEIPYKFPEDLTILPSEDLGKWYSRLGAYRGYAQKIAWNSRNQANGCRERMEGHHCV